MTATKHRWTESGIFARTWYASPKGAALRVTLDEAGQWMWWAMRLSPKGVREGQVDTRNEAMLAAERALDAIEVAS